MSESQLDQSLSIDELEDLVKQAYFWGMHPVGTYELRYGLTQLEGQPNYVGEGHIKWDRQPRTAADRSATTPNATTLYGNSFFDLSKEPAVIMLPAVPDRYFSVQASDQYPRWFLQVGNQFTGREAQQYLIVGPDFEGPYPEGFASSQVHVAPSNTALIFTRYALTSHEPDEIAAVNALMDQTSIVPLSVWEANGRQPLRAEDQPMVSGNFATIPRMADLVEISINLTGIDLLQMVSLVLNDPTMTLRTDSAKEVATLQQIARIGLIPGVTFDPDWLSDEQKQAVERAFAAAKEESAQHAQEALTNVNGWLLTMDLNPDLNDYVMQGYYGLETIGAPIPAQSHSGAFCFNDSEGQPLTGASCYTITFDTSDMPPVTQFWELPIYDDHGYFVENPINRYSINSYNYERGELHVADDKLVIYVQHDEPADALQQQNWLPAPEGAFQFAFRFYGPRDSLLNKAYNMPGVVRAA